MLGGFLADVVKGDWACMCTGREVMPAILRQKPPPRELTRKEQERRGIEFVAPIQDREPNSPRLHDFKQKSENWVECLNTDDERPYIQCGVDELELFDPVEKNNAHEMGIRALKELHEMIEQREAQQQCAMPVMQGGTGSQEIMASESSAPMMQSSGSTGIRKSQSADNNPSTLTPDKAFVACSSERSIRIEMGKAYREERIMQEVSWNGKLYVAGDKLCRKKKKRPHAEEQQMHQESMQAADVQLYQSMMSEKFQALGVGRERIDKFEERADMVHAVREGAQQFYKHTLQLEHELGDLSTLTKKQKDELRYNDTVLAKLGDERELQSIRLKDEPMKQKV